MNEKIRSNVGAIDFAAAGYGLKNGAYERGMRAIGYETISPKSHIHAVNGMDQIIQVPDTTVNDGHTAIRADSL
jgi:hypothetical protein